MRKHLHLWFLKNKMHVMSLVEYRTSVFLYTLAALSWFVGTIIFFSILYTQVEEIGGWSYYQMLFLYGFYTMTFCLVILFSWDSIYWQLRTAVKKGTLDQILAKPVNARMWVSTGFLDITVVVQLAISIILMAAAVVKGNLELNLLLLPLTIILAFCGQIITHCILFLIYCIPFWSTTAEHIDPIFWELQNTSKYPLTIYPQWLKLLLLTIMPLGFIAVIPAGLLLNFYDWKHAILGIVVTAVLFWISEIVWRAGLRKYEGVGS